MDATPSSPWRTGQARQALIESTNSLMYPLARMPISVPVLGPGPRSFWQASARALCSDLDILIVMPEGIHRRQTALVAYRALRGLGVPKDVIVVTERDIIEHGDNPSFVLKPALNEGREIYVTGQEPARISG